MLRAPWCIRVLTYGVVDNTVRSWHKHQPIRIRQAV